MLSGWRLLSDELTLIDRKTGLIQPLPRPVSLKNQSIDVIRQFNPDVYINRASHDTIKGTVAHMRPPRDSVLRQHETARPGWVIFPKWEAGATTRLTPRSKAQTFMFLAQNAFNYSHLGADGFRVGSALVDQTSLLRFPLQSAQRSHCRIRPVGRCRLVLPDLCIYPAICWLRTLRTPDTVTRFSMSEWDMLVRQARAAGLLARLAYLFRQTRTDSSHSGSRPMAF